MIPSSPILQWLRNYLGDIKNGLERFCGRYYGVYVGRVVDNVDPTGRGRIRATCPAIGVSKPEDVASNFWAVPCMAGASLDPDTGQITGFFNPPEIGAGVWIQFEYGDPRYPIYMGGFIPAKATPEDTFSMDDPAEKGLTKRGIRTKAGHYIRFNDDPDALEIMISKGDGAGKPTSQFISMMADGGTLITNANGSNIYMNAVDKETSFSNLDTDGSVLSMLLLGDDKITMVTKSGGAIGINKKDIVLTGDNVVTDANRQFLANAGLVLLGKGASEPVIRGYRFAAGWGVLHQHTTTAPGAPTTPGPTPPPMLYNELSEKVFIA